MFTTSPRSGNGSRFLSRQPRRRGARPFQDRRIPGIELLEDRTLPSFLPPVTFDTGTEPAAVVVGDFRGIGKLDLAVANLSSGNVSVLLGNGDGSFRGAVNYPLSTNPRSLAVGRFRGSQSPLDLAVVNHGDFSTTSSVSILLGNGDGSFRAGATYPVGQNSDAESVAVADFRGTGKLDLAVADYRGAVAFSSTDGQATLPANYTFTAADAGVHTFSNGVVLRTAGSQMVTARDTITVTITGGAGTTVVPGVLDHFHVLSSAGTITAGTLFDFTVTAQDGFNNTVSGYGGTVSFSSGDTHGATLPDAYTFTTGTGGDNGTHTFTGGATLYTAGSWDITATDASNPAVAGSALVSVIPAPAVSFIITAPDTAMAGVPFDFAVTATDPYGNTDTSYAGTVIFSTMDPAGTFSPTGYTFQAADEGMAIFPQGATLNTAGTWDVTATDSSDPTITGSTFVNVPAGPGSGHRSRSAGGRLDESRAFSLPIVSPSLGTAAAAVANVVKSKGVLALPSSQSLRPTGVRTSWENSLRDQVFCFLTGAEHPTVASELGPDRVPGNGHDLTPLLIDDAWLDGVFALPDT